MAVRASSVDVRLRLRGQRQFNKELKTAGVELEAMGLKGAKALSSFARQSDKLKSFGRTWGRNVTLPVLAGGALMVKAASDWESAFAGVRKTVSATPREFAALDQGLRKMSMRIPVAATELAEIAEAAGQLGIKRQAILGFTRTVADLGVATNLAGEEGAAALAKFANITQMPQSQFRRLGSTIVALGNAGASTEKDIAAMGLRLAAAGNFVGMSEPQILGFANALSSVGIEAEAGGTAMSQVFKSLNSAVAGGGKELEAFAAISGRSSGRFAQMWKKDAATATVAWVEGLSRLKAAGKDVPSILSELSPKLRGARIQDTLLRAAGAGTLLRQSLGLGVKSWKENNALSQEASKRYKTFKSQLQILKNIAINFAVVIGRELVPAVKDFAEWIGPKVKDAAKWFSGLSKSTKRVAIGATLLLAAVGPLAWGLGAIAGGVGKVLMGLRWLTQATWLWNGALLANPAFWIVAGLVALGAAFVIAYKKVGWFRDAVDAVMGAVKKAFGWIADNAGPALKWLTGALGDVIDFVKGNWQALLILLTGPVGVAVVTVVAHFDWIKNAVINSIGAIAAFMKKAIPAVVGFVKGVWQNKLFRILSWPIRTYIRFQVKLWTAVKDVVLKALNFVKSAWPAVSNFLKDPIGNSIEFIKTNIGKLPGFFASIPGRLKAAAGGMFNFLKDAFRGAINWIIRAWNGLEFKIPGFDPPGPGPKFGGTTIGVPDIPELAAGGTIRAPGLVEVGERGPELLNLPKAARVTPLEPQPINLQRVMGGIRKVIVPVHLDGRVITEVAADVAENDAAYAP